MRAHLTIATVNINGRTHLSDGQRVCKWNAVHATAKKKRIGIIAVQETHLDDAELNRITNLYGRRLTIYNSPLPGRELASAGVAFVLNREVVETGSPEVVVLVPGRAILLQIEWKKGQKSTLLNIYAPNDPVEQCAFWKEVEAGLAREGRTMRPDFVLGDFNIVEDPLDRAPMGAHNENQTTLDALISMRESINVTDAWRHTHESTRLFTHKSTRNHLSRLDRIYATPPLHKLMFEWAIGPTPIHTDHDMVKVKFAPSDAPDIGHGRWTWPAALLGNQVLNDAVIEKAWILQQEIQRVAGRETRSEERNPQTLLKAFKDDIKNMAMKTGQKSLPKMENRINSIMKDIGDLENNLSIDRDPETRDDIAILRMELGQLIDKKEGWRRGNEKATWDLKGETMSLYWINVNKEKRPRDTIHRLQVQGSLPPLYENTSAKMASIARAHYDQVQRPKEDAAHTPEQRELYIQQALDSIPEDRKLNAQESDKLAGEITPEDVVEAIAMLKAKKATGLDGIPYEIWRMLDKACFTKMVDGVEIPLTISGVLSSIFEDVKDHGVNETAAFNAGWLCPLYKKKDRTNPANYRPITLLNTDYKLMTKALSMRLAKTISKMIHEDQAGFIAGRSIFDHVRLTQTVIAHAEAEEQNRVIIALDQEKAYDRIQHDYLWRTLEEFRVPAPFIKAIKALYTGADTVVAVNSVMSEPFRVTRGVRQGDPLSCLLFDLAIEPLACLLRTNPTLEGIRIPGQTRRLLVNLFADDTLIYLSNNNRYDDLQKVLTIWCAAAGAKFNEDKTEVVPIGTTEHRARVLESRRLQPDGEPLEESIRIAADGHAIRSLGAWIGNNVDNAEPWSPIMDSIKSSLDQWQKGHPTMKGKRLIVQMVVGGKTQYLTRAQGMPVEVEKRISKMVREFIWDSPTASPISMATLSKPERRHRPTRHICQKQSDRDTLDQVIPVP
jgi:exonuclease III